MKNKEQHLCELEPTPIDNWARDHWSTLLYLEILAVDNKGFAKPEKARMRTNEIRHPHLIGKYFANLSGSKYPTRLKIGKIEGHDDWDCIDDAIEEKLVEDIGTGLNRVYKFTKLGKQVIAKLREFKQEGGQFKDFVFEKVDKLAGKELVE